MVCTRRHRRYNACSQEERGNEERLGLAHDLPHTNVSSHNGYRDYYTAEAKAIVACRFERDIARFGSQF
jgi:hypothetical protein